PNATPDCSAQSATTSGIRRPTPASHPRLTRSRRHSYRHHLSGAVCTLPARVRAVPGIAAQPGHVPAAHGAHSRNTRQIPGAGECYLSLEFVEPKHAVSREPLTIRTDVLFDQEFEFAVAVTDDLCEFARFVTVKLAPTNSAKCRATLPLLIVSLDHL